MIRTVVASSLVHFTANLSVVDEAATVVLWGIILAPGTTSACVESVAELLAAVGGLS